MKHLLLVVIALAASAALADIESFCGIKFGEEIGRRNKVHAGTGRLTGFKTLEKPFRSFNKTAHLVATPSTRKVCSVRLNCSLSKEAAEGEYQEVASVLKKKYGVEPTTNATKGVIRNLSSLNYDVGNCVITLTRTFNTLTLLAVDKNLDALREKESKEMVSATLKQDGDGADVL